MSQEMRSRLVRRLAVLALTVGVVVAAIGTVQVAAMWRADAAPLDTAPVGMEAIATDYAAEVARTEVLEGQVYEVSGQMATLRGAVLIAGEQVDHGSASAEALQQQLAKAKAKLDRLKGQLKGAQARLAALNAAAARQAAANASASKTSSAASSGGRSEPTREPEDEHDDD